MLLSSLIWLGGFIFLLWLYITLNALPPAHAGLQDKSYEGNNKGYIEQKGRQWSNQGDFILLFTV